MKNSFIESLEYLKIGLIHEQKKLQNMWALIIQK